MLVVVGEFERFWVFLFGDVEAADASVGGGDEQVRWGEEDASGFDAATGDDGGIDAAAICFDLAGADFAVVGGGEEAGVVGIEGDAGDGVAVGGLGGEDFAI